MKLTDLTLGEICDQGGGIVRTGPFGSQLHESDYSETGTPVVMPKDIIEGKVVEAAFIYLEAAFFAGSPHSECIEQSLRSIA